MFVELAFDVAREILKPAAQHSKILTEVFDPQSVGLGVITPDRLCGCLDKSASEFLADLVRTIVNDSGELLGRNTMKRRRSWVARQNGGGELALEGAHIPRELRKAQVNRSM